VGAVLALALSVLLAAACRRPAVPTQQVAVSIFPLHDIVRRVAGPRFDVRLILPPGHTTHFYDPRPREVAALSRASLVFVVGLGLDDWVAGMVAQVGAGRARTFELGPLVEPVLAPADVAARERDHRHGPMDPHFWLDPLRMQAAVDIVVEALQAVDPEEAPLYRTRGDELKRSLAQLHQELTRRAEQWRVRRIVTFHGSMHYFARRYGLEVVAVVEPVPGQEPGPRQLAALLERLRGEGEVALFAETQLDPRSARVIAAEAGLTLHTLDPVGGGDGADSYEALMLRIASVLDEALR
jgi:ABC-type Zn uptake system ZnuABC Zn-binding protein ZnuA